MIEIVSAKIHSRKTIEKIIFLVRSVVRSDDANRGRPTLTPNLLQSPRDFLEGIFPSGGHQVAIAANQRLSNTLRIIREIKAEPPFAAKKFAIDARLIAIICAQNLI